MGDFFRPPVLLPILIGVAVGALLFAVGSSEDAPGMCLIGLSIAFVLTMRGAANGNLIPKGFLAPIFLFCFGAGGIALSIILLLDGEFEESPGLALIGVAMGIVLLTMGRVSLKKIGGNKRGEDGM